MTHPHPFAATEVGLSCFARCSVNRAALGPNVSCRGIGPDPVCPRGALWNNNRRYLLTLSGTFVFKTPYVIVVTLEFATIFPLRCLGPKRRAGNDRYQLRERRENGAPMRLVRRKTRAQIGPSGPACRVSVFSNRPIRPWSIRGDGANLNAGSTMSLSQGRRCRCDRRCAWVADLIIAAQGRRRRPAGLLAVRPVGTAKGSFSADACDKRFLPTSPAAAEGIKPPGRQTSISSAENFNDRAESRKMKGGTHYTERPPQCCSQEIARVKASHSREPRPTRCPVRFVSTRT